MAYYRVCPECGCNLDPGEKCDCKKERAKKQAYFSRYLERDSKDGQMRFVFDERSGMVCS